MNKSSLALVFMSFVFSNLGASSSIGLIDLDGPLSEIRFAAIVEANSNDKVRLRICRNPIGDWKTRCTASVLESKEMARDTWVARVRQYLQIDRIQSFDSEKREREQVIIWSRGLIRKGIEDGSIDTLKKEAAENLLNEMLDAVEPNVETKERDFTQALFNRVVDFFPALPKEKSVRPLPVLPIELKTTLFKSIDTAEYQAVLSPFAQWITRSICRCELALGEGKSDVPSCVIRKGPEVLAWSPASLSECASRSSCNRRRWFSDDIAKSKTDFATLLASECDGYFTTGPILSAQLVRDTKEAGH